MTALPRVAIRLSMPNEMGLVSPIRQFLGHVVREQGFGEEPAHDIEIAVSEALTNVVEHGYPPPPAVHRIDVECEVDAQRCVITLRDEGKVFDPVTAPIASISEQRRERDFHLGTLYIRRCVDEIHYATRDGRNTLTLIRYRERARQTASR